MIKNFDTNKVYYARGLSSRIYTDIALQLVNEFHRYKIAFGELPQTSSPLHIWARDYMPVQVKEDKFVRFRYDPDYLKSLSEYKPDTKTILDEIDIKAIDSDIILDGGNIVSCGDKVIMTDKILQENQHYDKHKLMDKLESLIEAELVLIPWDVWEEYGHSDGMVRFIKDGRVLLNNYSDFDKSLRKKLLNLLMPHFEVSELYYGSHTNYSWAYINFLHVGQHIFIPMMNEDEAQKAFEQISANYPDCQCHPIWHCEELIKDGGALNCVTWNIAADLPDVPDYKEIPANQ